MSRSQATQRFLFDRPQRFGILWETSSRRGSSIARPRHQPRSSHGSSRRIPSESVCAWCHAGQPTSTLIAQRVDARVGQVRTHGEENVAPAGSRTPPTAATCSAAPVCLSRPCGVGACPQTDNAASRSMCTKRHGKALEKVRQSQHVTRNFSLNAVCRCADTTRSIHGSRRSLGRFRSASVLGGGPGGAAAVH